MKSHSEKTIGDQDQDIINIPLFQDILPVDLAQLLGQCIHSEMNEGDIVFEKDEESSCMSILLSGKVDLILNNSSIATLEAPTALGEIGFLSGKPRNATVKALTKIQILTITEQSFFSLFENEPELTRKIYRNLILGLRGKINKSNQQVLSLQKELKKNEKSLSESKNTPESNNPAKNEEEIPSPVSSTAMNNELPADVRRCTRIAVPSIEQCSVKIDGDVYPVKDISLGGLSIVFNESASIEDQWDEDVEVNVELKERNNPSFSFPGTILNIFSNLCRIQYGQLDSNKQKLIHNVIRSVYETEKSSQSVSHK